MPSDYATKLNLKETPTERARREEKAFRKAARRARREQRHGPSSNSTTTHISSAAAGGSPSSSSSTYRSHRTHKRHDSPPLYGSRQYRAQSPLTTPSPPRPTPLRPLPTDSPPHPHGSRPPTHSYYSQAASHDAAFEQRLRDLHAEDTGSMASASLDSWETGREFGKGLGWGDEPYVGQRIPKRWAEREGNVWYDPRGGYAEDLGGGKSSAKGFRGPGGLDEEEAYVESIRQGMYRKQNLPEILRQERLAAEALATAARLASLKAANEARESARLAQLAQTKSAAVEQGFEAERKAYEARWKTFVQTDDGGGGGVMKPASLSFREIPWPVFEVPHQPSGITLKDLRISSIRAFLLPSPTILLSSATTTTTTAEAREEEARKHRKDVLREAIRRYHPDKFTRHLPRVKEKDRAKVEEGVGIVGRCLVELMAEKP